MHILTWNFDVNVNYNVNIAWALKWGVTSIRITLLGKAHPILENISDARYTPVDGSDSGLQR